MRRTVLLVELVVWAFAAWLWYQMATTPDQRIRDRLRAYRECSRALWWVARGAGRLAMDLELAYHREVSA